ncbi:MAG TPA: NADH-quinone oxidoreductase subunit L, partial [Marinobacter sp.]|nr:NADH-quinone oxidoreductase subunit L [Marinobacter sp.]
MLAIGAVISGLVLAGWLFLLRRNWLNQLVAQGCGRRLWSLWHHAWGFDALFDRLLVRPWQLAVTLLRHDLINLAM